MRRSRFCRAMVVFLAVFALVPASPARGQAAGSPSLESLRRQRAELARRPRPIIMNNDGCDVLYFPKAEKATAEAFLAKRTAPLAGTQVASIAFCPTSSGFSYFTQNQVAFGAANSPMMGEAYWSAVKARATGLVLRDLAVSVSYEK